MNFVETTVREIIDKQMSIVKENDFRPLFSLSTFKAHLENNLNRSIKWSENVEFFGLHRSKNTDENTIDLSIKDIPRKFQTDNSDSILTEKDCPMGSGHTNQLN